MLRVSSRRLVFPVWAFLISGLTMVLMVYVLMCFGMNGSRLARRMIPVWLFLHSPAWLLRGILRWHSSMVRLWEKRLSTVARI